MKVGFLGFGEVALTLSSWLKEGGAEVYTSLENRSPKTQTRAKKSGVNICDDNQTLAELSDILISSVTPAEAVNIAQEVGKHVKGLYVDVNNISPQTTNLALCCILNGKTVDAAIMGRVVEEGNPTLIVASGEYAGQFSMLNKYGLNIKVLDHELGQAKALKMLRSYYTKGVSALLFESLFKAYNLGLDDDFLRCLEITECPNFKGSAISRIKNSTYHAERKLQEMDEVYMFMKDYHQDGTDKNKDGFGGHKSVEEDQQLKMVKSTQEFYKNISSRFKLDEKPENYQELFKILMN